MNITSMQNNGRKLISGTNKHAQLHRTHTLQFAHIPFRTRNTGTPPSPREPWRYTAKCDCQRQPTSFVILPSHSDRNGQGCSNVFSYTEARATPTHTWARKWIKSEEKSRFKMSALRTFFRF